MADISVFIPVYKQSEQLPGLLRELVSQNADKEVIVTIDEPNEAFLEDMKPFENVKFIINEKRIGKANALNDSIKQS